MKTNLKIISVWMPAVLFTFGSLALLSHLENGYQEEPPTATILPKTISLTEELNKQIIFQSSNSSRPQ